MENVILGHGNIIAATVLSGGSWEAALPLNNLKDRRYARVARSTDTALASTLVNIDAVDVADVRVVSLLDNNLSLDALYRVRGCTEPTFAAAEYDSGWSDVWPAVYPFDALDFEAPNWWSGKPTEADRAGQLWNLIHAMPTNRWLRYWRIEIDDQTNPDGYVQAGRAFIGEGWQAEFNMEAGAGIGIETGTVVRETLSGGERFRRKKSLRVVRFSLGKMSETEAMTKALEVQRRMGTDGEVMFIWDQSDVSNSLRRSFCGRFRTLTAIDMPIIGAAKHRTAFEVKENLG